MSKKKLNPYSFDEVYRAHSATLRTHMKAAYDALTPAQKKEFKIKSFKDFARNILDGYKTDSHGKELRTYEQKYKRLVHSESFGFTPKEERVKENLLTGLKKNADWKTFRKEVVGWRTKLDDFKKDVVFHGAELIEKDGKYVRNPKYGYWEYNGYLFKIVESRGLIWEKI